MIFFHSLSHRIMKHIATSPARTAGPWFIDRQSPHSPICIKPYPGRIVCDIGGTDAESEANARLICAAPDLLRACDRAVKDLAFLQSCAKISRQETIDSLEAAVSKALTGENPKSDRGCDCEFHECRCEWPELKNALHSKE